MRRATAILSTAAAALALPAAAAAHVSLHPNVVPVGANATLDIRVPNEMDNAKTTKLQVQFPPGFIDVSTEPPPGWSARMLTSRLATPVKADSGTVDTQVREVDWTARAGAGIPAGEFANFPISVLIPGRPGAVLTFKVVQTYGNGKVVRWIGPPSADTPAPTIDVTARGGDLRDVAGGEAGPGALPASGANGGARPAATTTKVVEHTRSDTTLAIVALVLGAVGVALGGAGLAAARRARTRAAA